ncbi:MAG: potassium-transporting ATPase subunit B, partial [Magnetococcales bacterium]|nr:potassium-transporting ATPase subunit B [Magnetococcales bacterium]
MQQQAPLLDPALLREAVIDSFKRLSPRYQLGNPVMFVVWLGSLLTSGLFVQSLLGQGEAPAGFILEIALWLWFTVLFANFAEAVAEGRGKAQAAALKGLRRTVLAKKLREPRPDARWEIVPSESLRRGDVVLVTIGEVIPGDGEVIEGVASVDESAITGESAPV